MPFCERCQTLWVHPATCNCDGSEEVGSQTFTLEQVLLFIAHAVSAPDLPCLRALRDLSIPAILRLGDAMGRGGTNSVYELTGQPMVLAKNAGASMGTSREYRSLVEMERIGLSTVRRELVTIDRTQMILMNRVLNGIDSKSIIGYQRTLGDYVSLQCDSPAPSSRWADFLFCNTVTDLITSFQLMQTQGTNFSDYQFMIDVDGSVLHNDPVDVIPFKSNGGSTRTIIQAIIDTWEFLNLPIARGMGWRDFKLLKKALQTHRVREFCKRAKKTLLSLPALCILDFRAIAWGNTMSECVCFRATSSFSMDDWTCAQLGVEYWYVPCEALPQVRPLLGSVHYDGATVDPIELESFLKHLDG